MFQEAEARVQSRHSEQVQQRCREPVSQGNIQSEISSPEMDELILLQYIYIYLGSWIIKNLWTRTFLTVFVRFPASPVELFLNRR